MAADALAAARRALAEGQPVTACELLRDLLAAGDERPEVRYLCALAHARGGALGLAAALLEPLLGEPGAAVLGADLPALAGRIAKDRWARLPPGPAREVAGAEAIARYAEAWRGTGDPFPGVNAASLLLLGGRVDEARALAREVEAACSPSRVPDAVWRAATLGELALLRGDAGGSLAHYAEAAGLAGRARAGDVATMRRQLRLLGPAVALPDGLWRALAVPRVLAFSGHMLDQPGRDGPRFPPGLEPAATAALDEAVAALRPDVGYCSAACGGDLLFVEALLRRGAEVHLVLPFAREDFLATSVAFAGGDWVARFERALARASSVRYGVEERFLGDEALYGHGGLLMLGAAVLHARQLEDEAAMLALHDPAAPPRDGGTGDLLARWRALGLPATVIDLGALRRAAPAEAPRTAPEAPAGPAAETRAGGLQRQAATMLFADMVGFSRMREEATPAWLVHFLGAIAELRERSPTPPRLANTWGDGLFMVFDRVADAAGFALDLREAVRGVDWASRGLPADTSVRMGMHTGPVFPARDPLIGRDNVFGSHVNRAARIEPVAAPGDVLVSAEFAALHAVSGARGFVTDYLGRRALAKGFGEHVLYRLRREHEAD